LEEMIPSFLSTKGTYMILRQDVRYSTKISVQCVRSELSLFCSGAEHDLQMEGQSPPLRA